VRRRVEGREHILSVNPGGLDEVARWIDAQRDLWAGAWAAWTTP